MEKKIETYAIRNITKRHSAKDRNRKEEGSRGKKKKQTAGNFIQKE